MPVGDSRSERDPRERQADERLGVDERAAAMRPGTSSKLIRSMVMCCSSTPCADDAHASRSSAMNTNECSSQKPGEL